MSNRYFDFLYLLVKRPGEKRTYNMLLSELHNINFYSLIPNDDNREEDGKGLRMRFIDEEGEDDIYRPELAPHTACTVLEMLIALSLRLEFETAQSRWEKSPAEWFWILIDNLGLQEYSDDVFLELERASQHDEKVSQIHEKVSQMLERRYEKNGFGGLFPLKNPRKDQRRVEIWYQMSAYILENYPI